MKRILALLFLLLPAVVFGFMDNPFGSGGGGDMSESTYSTGGIIKTSKGGTGQDSSGSTGVPYIASGTWSFKTFAQFMALMGVTYNPADNTWTFLASITYPSAVSSAADNTHYWNATNTADPTTTNLALGNAWYNKTDKLWRFRTFDNSATGEFLTSESTNTLNFATTGTVTAAINVVAKTDNNALSGAQVYGSMIECGAGCATVTLPAKVQGMSVCIMATDNVQKNVDTNGSDFILYEGASFGAGHKATSVAAGATAPIGEYLCLYGSAVANQWIAVGRGKTAWTDGGA